MRSILTSPLNGVLRRAVVPEAHRAGVDAVAAAVRAVDTEWHELFLAVAGALLEVGVEPEYVPALCGAISDATGADRHDRRHRMHGLGLRAARRHLRRAVGLALAGGEHEPTRFRHRGRRRVR
jgi:hypothetical protein